MKKAIITGCTGAIGTALIRELSQNGYEVTAVVREGSKRISSVPVSENVSVIECSLENISSLPDILPHNYDVFYHFAWQGTFGAQRNDYKMQSDNIKYALDAVDAAKALGCKRFIGAGSQAEYGRVEGVLTPNTPCNPENGYGIAKLAAGMLTRLQCGKLGLGHIWVRILSVYGPNDTDGSMIMSGIREMLLGNVPRFTKGEQIWDYLYSEDAARALRLVFEKGKSGKVYCLSGGKAEMLRDYIDKMCRAVRKNGNVNARADIGAVPYAENQVMHLCADISELTNDTGFTANVSFEDGIAETVAHMRLKIEEQNK